jgi:hypothetical protein
MRFTIDSMHRLTTKTMLENGILLRFCWLGQSGSMLRFSTHLAGLSVCARTSFAVSYSIEISRRRDMLLYSYHSTGTLLSTIRNGNSQRECNVSVAPSSSRHDIFVCCGGGGICWQGLLPIRQRRVRLSMSK